jgi:uncharacterized RDD family membrane protein YckC
MENNNWHYAAAGSGVRGPMSKFDLGRILRAEFAAAEFLVWCPGMPDWARAGDVPTLGEFLYAPPPIPASRPRSKSTAPLSAERRVQPALNVDVRPHDERAAVQKHFAAEATHPWRRYFARLLDTMAFSFAFFFCLGIMFPSLFQTDTKGTEQLYNLLAVFAYVPFEAFCMTAFGTTIGKSLYGIQVTNSVGGPITLRESFKRSFDVWTRGWGLAIPIIALFTLVTAYKTLTRDGITSWDRELLFVVEHRPFSYLRLFLLPIIWLLLLAFWAYAVSLN